MIAQYALIQIQACGVFWLVYSDFYSVLNKEKLSCSFSVICI